MKLALEMNCDNAAFGDGNGGHEVARILRKLADRLEEHSLPEEGDSDEGRLVDYNGNVVGKWNID